MTAVVSESIAPQEVQLQGEQIPRIAGVCGPAACVHQGLRTAGSLVNDVAAPAQNGAGHRHYHGNDSARADCHDDFACADYMHALIPEAGRQYSQLPLNGAVIQWGDISRPGGGLFWRCLDRTVNDHTQHQNGLDVDVRYVRNDRALTGLNLLQELPAYDRDATERSLRVFLDLGATRIIVNQRSDLARIDARVIDDTRDGHRDHFHVEFPDPDGSNN